MKSLVVFSGGQDSTTCLLKVLSEGDEVEALSFNYGQKNVVENEVSEQICRKLGVKRHILDISAIMKAVSDTPYVGNGELGGKSKTDSTLPSTWVPNRNLIFAVIAHSLAVKKGFDRIVLGVNAVDYSGYPDCRPEFINSLYRTLGLSVPSVKVDVYCPLINLSKKDIWELANSLGKLQFVIEETHTCYNGNHTDFNDWGYGCGECDSCRIRKESFEEFRKSL